MRIKVKFLRPIGWLFSIWLVIIPYPTVLAQSTEPGTGLIYKQAKQLTNEGTKLFRSSDYEMARDRFEKAYLIHPDPNLLYNIARCFEEEGNLDMAIEKLSQYLAVSKADSVVRKKAIARLNKLQRLRSRMEYDIKKQNKTQESEKHLVDTLANGSVDDLDKNPDLSAGRVTETHSTSSFNWKLWKWTSLGVGAAAAIAGGIVFSLGEADHRKVFNAQHENPVFSMTRARASDLVESGNDKKTIGYICFGAGSAIMLGSLVLFLIEPGRLDTEKDAGISVLPNSNGGLFVWRHRF